MCRDAGGGWPERGEGRCEPIAHHVLILAIKGLAGGSLVVVFALISESVDPKRFAGLFGAAPAVALVGLAVTILDKGRHDAHQSAVGMLGGSAGMIAYAGASVGLLRRMRAGRAAALALCGWALGTGLIAVPLLLA